MFVKLETETNFSVQMKKGPALFRIKWVPNLPHNACEMTDLRRDNTPFTHLNKEVFQLLPWRQIDHVLVNSTLSLEKLFIEQIKYDSALGSGVHRHPKVVGMSGRDAHMAYKNSCKRYML